MCADQRSVVLQGRYAGKKVRPSGDAGPPAARGCAGMRRPRWRGHADRQVVVIKQHDEGTKEHSFPHVIAAGIERYPLKVTKSMGAKKLAKRSKVKPFVKVRGMRRLARCSAGALCIYSANPSGHQLQPHLPDALRA